MKDFDLVGGASALSLWFEDTTDTRTRLLVTLENVLDEAWEEGYEAGFDAGNDVGYQLGLEDQGDEPDAYAQDLSDLLDELDAYEAERTYDEAYYDPFTRDVDWRLFR